MLREMDMDMDMDMVHYSCACTVSMLYPSHHFWDWGSPPCVTISVSLSHLIFSLTPRNSLLSWPTQIVVLVESTI